MRRRQALKIVMWWQERLLLPGLKPRGLRHKVSTWERAARRVAKENRKPAPAAPPEIPRPSYVRSAHIVVGAERHGSGGCETAD